MKLLEKFKSFLYDEDEVEEQEEIVKKIDVKKPEVKEEKKISSEPIIENRFDNSEYKKEEPKGPIIFNDEDFMTDTREEDFKEPEKPIKNDKILYGGYEDKKDFKDKEKFNPSPVISPVYGILDKNYKKEEVIKKEKKSLDHLFVEERKKAIDLDSIREKAFGETKEIEPEEKDLLYDVSQEDKPGIDKITIGDAEEYFDDLGLEYNIDYKDNAKEKMTRSSKNKELTEMVEEEIKENKKIEKEMGKQIEEIVPIVEEEIKVEEQEEEPEEKNLYDLIDMMYDSKE